MSNTPDTLILIGKLLLTAAVGAAGGILCKKKKLFPAAYMIGAFLAVLIFSLGAQAAYFPSEARIATRILVGAHLGMRLRREQLRLIAKNFSSMAAIIVCLLFTMVILGASMNFFGGMDLETAFYSSAPGGVSDMAIIAEALGADTLVVSVMQLTRLMTVFAYYPGLYGMFLRRGILKVTDPREKAEETRIGLPKRDKATGMVLVMSLALAGGLLGQMAGIPGGALTISMLFVVTANLFTARTYLPHGAGALVQVFSGIYLGAQFTRHTVGVLSTIIVPLILMVISVTTLPLITGFVVSKITKMDLATALFCCTPGGMAEMTLMAEDIGIDIAVVSVSHAVRVVAVVGLFPLFIGLLTGG